MSCLWIVGMLFTWGLFTSEEDFKTPVSKIALATIIIIVLWPAILGLKAGELITEFEKLVKK